MTNKDSLRRFALVFALGGCYVGLGLVLRLVLWGRFGIDADVPVTHLPLLLAGGIANDAVESLYLLAPLSLYVFLVPDRWYRSGWNRALEDLGVAYFQTASELFESHRYE